MRQARSDSAVLSGDSDPVAPNPIRCRFQAPTRAPGRPAVLGVLSCAAVVSAGNCCCGLWFVTPACSRRS